MDNEKKMSCHLMLWIFVWFVILGVGVAVSVQWETGAIKAAVHSLGSASGQSFASIDAALARSAQRFWKVLGVSLLVAGLLLWVSLRSSLKGLIGALSGEKKGAVVDIPESVPENKVKADNENRRRELHLMSLLQREGRLTDFLKEDLEHYADAQIGAAVRSIQEKCQKTLNRYVDPKPIIDQEEGTEVTVPEGFDPSSIKLTGNVSGNPPFKGILQHRGWRAVRRNLPILSGTLDPDVIAPAEVEIPE